MRKRLLSNPLLVFVAACLLLYIASWVIWPPRVSYDLVIMPMTVAMTVSLIGVWGAAGVRALRHGAFNGVNSLAFGICLAAVALAGRAVYGMFYRYNFWPPSGVNSRIIGLMSIALIVGLALITTSPIRDEERLRLGSWWPLYVAGAIGLLIAGIVIGINLGPTDGA